MQYSIRGIIDVDENSGIFDSRRENVPNVRSGAGDIDPNSIGSRSFRQSNQRFAGFQVAEEKAVWARVLCIRERAEGQTGCTILAVFESKGNRSYLLFVSPGGDDETQRRICLRSDLVCFRNLFRIRPASSGKKEVGSRRARR